MSGPAVPRRVREITPEWLTDVLAAGGRLEDARVADVDVENISAGVGFAGRALRLDITYDPSDTPLPGSLILKLPSPDPGMREMMNALRGYELEGRFYEQLAEQTPLRVPVCYWSAVDVEGGDYALLLEHLDGLRTGDQQASCTESEAEAIVRALATMHAAWWDSQELRRHDWLPAFDETGAVWQERSRVGLQPFLDQHGGWLPDGFDSTNERIVERLIELQGGVDGSPQTLVHGDFRLENMMFGEPRSDDELVIIDWQLLGFGPGTYDLAYFMGQSLTVEMRRAREEDLLRLYLDTLMGEGVDGYLAERLQADYRRGLAAMRIPIYGARILETLASVVREQRGARREGYEAAFSAGVALMRLVAERNVTAILDTNAAELLPA